MKTGLKIWTAITSFVPVLFILFCIVIVIINRFTVPEPVPGQPIGISPFMGVLIIAINLLPLVCSIFSWFNMIFDIVYIVRSGKFNGNQTALWIVLTILLSVFVAPVFWCVYLRTSSPDKPMFPPETAEQP